MASKELASIKRLITITPGTTIIDTQDFEALTFVLRVGNGTAVSFQDGDESDLSDAADVAATFIIGDTSFTADGNAIIGYVGKKRYVRMQAITTPVANSTVFAIPEALRVIGTLQDVDKTTRG